MNNFSKLISKLSEHGFNVEDGDLINAGVTDNDSLYVAEDKLMKWKKTHD